jgi:hypothetical protein
MKTTFVCVAMIALLFGLGYFATVIFGSGDDDLTEMPQATPEMRKGWAYGFVEHQHDLDKPNLFYTKLQWHEEADIPNVKGGYAMTDVDAFVKLRGVDVGKALHHARHRGRPFLWQREERQRWADTMTYLWNLIDQTHTLRVHNMKHIGTELDGDTYEDGILEADMEILLGGVWHNLAIMMMQDDMARPIQADGSEWDPGSREYSLLNPNIPK